MGTRRHLKVVVGLHVDAPADASGRSLRMLLDAPEEEIVSVLNRRLGRGRVFIGDRFATQTRREVIVGVVALEGTHEGHHDTPTVEGPLAPDAWSEAVERAGEVLTGLGATLPPRVYMLYTVTY